MDQLHLFEENNDLVYEPLASRMRPRDLSEFYGQKHLLDKDRLKDNTKKEGSLIPLCISYD